MIMKGLDMEFICLALIILPVVVTNLRKRKREGIEKQTLGLLYPLGDWLEKNVAAAGRISAGMREQQIAVERCGEKSGNGKGNPPFQKCVAGAWCMLFILLFLFAAARSFMGREENVTVLQRGDIGDGEQSYLLQVEGINDEKEVVEVQVRGREPSDGELETLLDKTAEQLKTSILNGNPSLDQVSGDLLLPDRVSGNIRADWYPQNPELMDFTGELLTDELPETGTVTVLTLMLRYKKTEKTYQFPVRLVPAEQTKNQKMRKKLESLLKKAVEEDPAAKEIYLPEELEGGRLTYTHFQENPGGALVLLTAAGAGIGFWIPAGKIRRRYQERERQLRNGYAGMVSKLAVLTGAGLTMRSAWERLADDYQKKLKEGISKKNYVYEEVVLMVNQIRQGAGENRAYGEFGRRCGLYPYLRLSGLLEQNLSKGTRGMQGMLLQEVQNAFEERKNLARKLGEEAGSKMMLPLFMLLGVVLVIVTVPAFLAF